MVLVDLIIEETDVFFYCFKQKKIFSVILNLSNNTKYHRTGFFALRKVEKNTNLPSFTGAFAKNDKKTCQK